MAYVDGFVIPIAKRKVKAYLKMARLGAKIWKKYGALEYYECVGDDLKVTSGMGMGFGKLAKLKRNETVVFSFIVYKSRAQRDRINRKAMQDPALNDPELMKSMPVDMKRFAMGGFKVLVSF
jgi:uncharacterized protein YbaA (DUF1428 family)